MCEGCHESSSSLRFKLDGSKIIINDGKSIQKIDLSSILNPSNILEHIVPITSDNQITFENSIPTGRNVLMVFLNGVLQVKDTDYRMEGRTLIWINGVIALSTGYELKIFTT